MKKTGKKLTAVLLILAMCVSMVTPVRAATKTSSTSDWASAYLKLICKERKAGYKWGISRDSDLEEMLSKYGYKYSVFSFLSSDDANGFTVSQKELASNFKYNLVYLDGDDIPELVIENQNTSLAIGIYGYNQKTGKVYQILNHAWDVSEAHGEQYQYLPKKNMICYCGGAYPLNYRAECNYYKTIKNHKLKDLFKIAEGYYAKTDKTNWKKISSKKITSLIKGKTSDYKNLVGKDSYSQMWEKLINKGAKLTKAKDATIKISSKNFPDKNFRSYILEEIDKDCDGWLSKKEIKKVTEMDVAERSIKSLKGINYFTELVGFNCIGNKLTSLDLRKNKKLISLNCSYNQLTSLLVYTKGTWEGIDCSHNKLKKVAFPKKIWLLYCSDNKFTKLDVSKMGKYLGDLDCSNNQLKSLDLTKNVNLELFACTGNNITKLDLSKNKYLEELLVDSTTTVIR